MRRARSIHPTINVTFGAARLTRACPKQQIINSCAATASHKLVTPTWLVSQRIREGVHIGAKPRNRSTRSALIKIGFRAERNETKISTIRRCSYIDFFRIRCVTYFSTQPRDLLAFQFFLSRSAWYEKKKQVGNDRLGVATLLLACRFQDINKLLLD